MALKDRLEARRHPETTELPSPDAPLTVIDGTRPEPEPAPLAEPAEELSPRTKRLPTEVATAKQAIHALLVERHAHEIDITDRAGVRTRIATLAEEYVKTSGIALNRLDY